MDLKPGPSCINLVPGNYECVHYEFVHSLGSTCLFIQNCDLLQLFMKRLFQTNLCILHQSCNNPLSCPKFGHKAENGCLLTCEENLTPLG